MSLTPEWRGRIEHWRDTLEKLLYVKLGDVALRGFVTREQLTPSMASSQRFEPMPAGTRWGAKWEYAWFRGRIELPREASGRRIVLRFGAGDPPVFGGPGEGLVYINGREAGARDYGHHEILLAARGRAGAVYDVLVEAYAGHGPMVCGGGPCPDGSQTVPEPPAAQRVVGETSFGIWEEDLYQAWMDLQTLLELRDHLDQDSLRVAEIDAALREFTTVADLELPRDEMKASVRAARGCLAPLLDCRNGSTAPTLYCFGHSHIDVAWLWPLVETERKCARTFSSQLALMEQYPEYKFLQSQAHVYLMTKRRYPRVYARIKAAVKKGQWLVEGGMWVEADTNIPSGESLIRQFVHGKKFFRDEFGVACELLWLPDVFGYSAALPQIMAGCGIKYFSTQKIFWNYNGGEPFPYNTFWWEGIDGTRVLSHLHNDYNSYTNPATLIRRWRERVQKDGISARIVPFGWGDGGGGPGRNHVEFLRRQRDLEGAPRARIASPIEFFKAEEAHGRRLPVYVGELYFQAHRGTLTTQARTKRLNRKSELALREAEVWGAAASALAGLPYPAAQMDRAWKDVLLNQFHDIIPGSSIRRVYEEAEALYAEVIALSRQKAEAAARALLRKDKDAVAVFNSLSWDRKGLVRLPRGFTAVSRDGQPLPTQRIEGHLYAEVEVPACGWTTLRKAAAASAPRAASTLRATPTLLENEHLRLSLDALGEIASLVDKDSGRELAAGPLNAFRMYKDVPRTCDAWDIDSTYKSLPVELPGKAAVELVAAGPLVAVLRVRRRLHDSTVTQDISLRSGSRRVDFCTQIDWHEKHKLLKVNFATAIHANEAIHEIQFGHLRRPNHQSRPFDADRFEVANQKWTALAEENRGVAVLNDCKYGVNVEGGSINLTLLRSPLAPDMQCDQGIQQFTYAFYAWNGSFSESDVVREAYDLNVPLMVLEGGSGEGGLFQLDAPNVVIETVKPAEDGSGDVVVRLYEAKRSATRCTLRTSFAGARVFETNMLEESGRALVAKDGAISLDFRPFEIKTLRLKLAR